MIAAQLLDAGVRSHGYNLAELVKVYLGEEFSKEQQRSDWSNPSLSSKQLEYAARDAAILLRLREGDETQVDRCPFGGNWQIGI